MLTFVETRLFTSLVHGYLSDEEYSGLQQALADNPDAGSIAGHVLKRIKEEIDGGA